MLKIYTKTGDRGETSLFGGKRVSKASLRVEAYGTVDELQSILGLVIVEIENPCVKIAAKSGITRLKKILFAIQADLFEIAFSLANPKAKPIKGLEKQVKKHELLIDQLTAQMRPLRNFIFPGGGWGGSFLHIARSTARRAERRIVDLSYQEKVDQEILIYVNRLSDLLFTMARFVNAKEDKKETEWKRS